MKVNISGVGLIPKVGLLAPVYGKDLSKDTVSVILKYASFKVYVAATGIRITKKNIDEIFGTVVKQSASNVSTTKKTTTKVSTPVEIEQVATPVEFNEVVEAPAIEETADTDEIVADATESEIESSFIEDVASVQEQLDETPVAEKSITTHSKKKKRH
jgi:hypothetical protein